MASKNAEYYAIKHKKAKRWVAYRLTPAELKTLRDDYEYRGPYTGVFSAMVGVDKKCVKS